MTWDKTEINRDDEEQARWLRQWQEEQWRAQYRARYGRRDNAGLFMAFLCLMACAFSWVGCKMLGARHHDAAELYQKGHLK
jgi:hypothetical protein